MHQSGHRTRRHVPVVGPTRLTKSNGEFTPKALLYDAKKAISRPVRDNFTPGSCLAAGSLDRPNVRNMSCNIGSCPAGYTAYGYEPGETYNWGSACYMRNMICIKSNYDKDTWSVVADCCNGVTPEKDCDPTLCRSSQSCRDKMRAGCDNVNTYGTPQCQTWLNAGENADMKAEILPKYCTATDLASGPCRNFAQSAASYGLMDAAVMQWCTGKIPNPPLVDPKITDYARWMYKGGPQPTWFMNEYYLTAGPIIGIDGFKQQWMIKTMDAISRYGMDAVTNPQVTYRDNSKDPICACILSPLNKYGDKAAPPSCFDTSCVAGGYQTGGMKAIAARCPSWVECRSNVMAASGGSNENVNVQQICGGPPIDTAPTVATPASPTPSGAPPMPSLPVPPADDKDKLLADEQRGATGSAPSVLPVIALPSLSDQLHKPFMPGSSLFGDTSIVSVAIIFFAIVIISVILWRTWMNRRSADLAARRQAEQNVISQSLVSPIPEMQQSEVQAAVSSQMSTLPPLGTR